MGLAAAALITVLALIPFAGGLLIGLAAPILLASACLAIDPLSRTKAPVPSARRMAELKQGPAALVAVFSDEAHMGPAVVAGGYGLVVTLLISILVRFLAGGAWEVPWGGLDLLSLIVVLATALLALALYGVLAASLIYALPLVLLQDEALVPAVRQSLKAAARYPFAVMTVLALPLAPFALGALAAYLAPLLTYLFWLLGGALAFPFAATGAYCSYRTLFPVEQAQRAAG